jgi:hypothetical protein
LYELLSVGDNKIDGKPAGKVLSLDPFTFYAFFESNPKQLETKGLVSVELFAGVADGQDCDTGTMILSTSGTDSSIVTTSIPYDGYDAEFADTSSEITYPTTLNGRVGAAEVSLSDFRLPKNDQQIYFPGIGEKDGQIDVCVRMALKGDYKGDEAEENISFIDTFFIVDVDLTANFESFSGTSVQIYSNQATDLETDVTATVDVEAYLCDSDNKKDTDKVKFTDGQDFRICVKPANDDIYKYYVEKYESITCSNDGETRQIVADGNADALTTIDGSPAADGSLGFTSVVTSGFLTPKNAVLADFKCSGDVSLSAVDKEERRGLIANSGFSSFTKTSSSSSSSSSSISNNERKMQNNAAPPPSAEDAPFAVAIELADPTSDESSSPSYGPLLGLYYMASFGTVAAAAAAAALL